MFKYNYQSKAENWKFYIFSVYFLFKLYVSQYLCNYMSINFVLLSGVYFYFGYKVLKQVFLGENIGRLRSSG